jgi:hypothetical protein
MDELIYDPNVKIWCHGHTHSSFDYIDIPDKNVSNFISNMTSTRVLCNPRGYTYKYSPDENREFDDKLTFNVNFFTLVNPCKYSFTDLINASNMDTNTDELYAMSQFDRNKKVKELCFIAKWYWKDVIEDGISYTSFSPEIKYTCV